MAEEQPTQSEIKNELLQFVDETLARKNAFLADGSSSPTPNPAYQRGDQSTPATSIIPVGADTVNAASYDRNKDGVCEMPCPPDTAAILVKDDGAAEPVRWLEAPDSTNSYVPILVAGVWQMEKVEDCTPYP